MNIQLTEGRIILEEIEVFSISDNVLVVDFDFVSKRPSLISYGVEDSTCAAFDFDADEETLMINKESNSWTSISIWVDKPIKDIVCQEPGKYTCRAVIFLSDVRNSKLMASYSRGF